MDNKLIEILKTATTSSIFYEREFRKYGSLNNFYQNFKLTKADIINNKQSIICSNYKGNLYKHLQVNTTSGTSGTPVTIFWAPDDLARSNISIWRMRKKFHGISPSDCFCELHTVSYMGSRIKNIEKIIVVDNRISFCKLFYDDLSMMEYYNVMKQLKPKWLLFQPSFAVRFVSFCLRNKLESISSIKYIEFTGEMLAMSSRIYVTSFFGDCESANMYGCMETNSIAYEYPDGKMHIMGDNVAVEVDDNNHVYLTSLTNKQFPLIKYDVGDKIDLIKTDRGELVISSIIGRTSREVHLGNNRVLTEAMIAYCVERTESIVGIGLIQYRAFFNNNKLDIKIIAKTGKEKWQNAFIQEVKDQFEKLCDYNEVYVQFINQQSLMENIDNSGKYCILEVL